MARKPRKRNYGSGSVRFNGKTYDIQVRVNGKRVQRRGFPTKELAEAAIAAAVAADPSAADPATAPPLATLATTWLEQREVTHRSGDDDRKRWTKHLEPTFGRLRPDQLTPEMIHNLVKAKLAAGLSASSCGLLTRLLSTFYTDLVDAGMASRNPAKGLPRKTRRLTRSTHDPKDTPFLRSLDDVVAVYRALPDPYAIAFAIGAFAGLRTGEVRALSWVAVDMKARLIYVRNTVRNGELGPTKDHETRAVPIMDSLYPVLEAWQRHTGGMGLVIKPLGNNGSFTCERKMNRALRKALQGLKLTVEGLAWYEATRHTFASHYVMEGGSIEVLKALLGHSTILVTERYAHLLPSRVQADRGRFTVKLTAELTAVDGGAKRKVA